MRANVNPTHLVLEYFVGVKDALEAVLFSDNNATVPLHCIDWIEATLMLVYKYWGLWLFQNVWHIVTVINEEVAKNRRWRGQGCLLLVSCKNNLWCFIWIDQCLHPMQCYGNVSKHDNLIISYIAPVTFNLCTSPYWNHPGIIIWYALVSQVYSQVFPIRNLDCCFGINCRNKNLTNRKLSPDSRRVLPT